jgi:hypothetical protein
MQEKEVFHFWLNNFLVGNYGYINQEARNAPSLQFLSLYIRTW